VSITGNVAVMAVLTGQAGVPALPANAVSIATCGLVNFWLGERVVFRRDVAPVR
jgi:putative flippase GtrA